MCGVVHHSRAAGPLEQVLALPVDRIRTDLLVEGAPMHRDASYCLLAAPYLLAAPGPDQVRMICECYGAVVVGNIGEADLQGMFQMGKASSG